jgi:biotin-dependent carboxylase-like uncharacterized protein
MFEVVDPGALSTVQDGGRPGHLDLGVPVSGACDTWSLAVANLLLDNPPDAPALEITLAGPVLAVRQTGVIAIAGADLGGEVPEEGRRLAPGSSHRVNAGTHLRFEGARSGLRAYLALPGGIAAPSVLDSASTCLPGGFGGIDGRALRAGDQLRPVRGPTAGEAGRRWPAGGPDPLDGAPVRLIPSADPAGLAPGALAAIVDSPWIVSTESDRVGVRLSGPAITAAPEAADLVSRGVVPGTMQLPPGGPIILLADGPTVGGYPVAGVVARADLARVAQARPGAELRFVSASVAEAQAAWRYQAAVLREMARRLEVSGPWETHV